MQPVGFGLQKPATAPGGTLLTLLMLQVDPGWYNTVTRRDITLCKHKLGYKGR